MLWKMVKDELFYTMMKIDFCTLVLTFDNYKAY